MRIVPTTVNAILLGALAGGGGAALAAQAAKAASPAGKLHHEFSSITGFRELADGRVMVSDGIDEVLVRADFASQRMDTVGRSGQGPGEYKSPDALHPLPEGATLLVDLGNGRLSIFGADGKYRESMPIAQGQPGGPGGLQLIVPRGTDQRGRLYFQSMGGMGGARDSAPVLRLDRAAGRTDTIAQVKLPAVVTRTSGGANNRNVSQRPAPYPVQDAWVVSPDGRVALVRGSPYRVDWATGGSVKAGSAVTAAPVRIGAAEKKEYLEFMAANSLSVAVEAGNGSMSVRMGRGSQGRGIPDPSEYEWPETKPVFPADGVTSGADGSIWVERSAPAGAALVYDVFGAQGEVVAKVSLPKGRRLVGVGPKYLYARAIDADGISRLERYER